MKYPSSARRHKSDELHRLAFTDIPTITIDELSAASKNIKRLAGSAEVPGFGALVVRGGGEEVAVDFVERFKSRRTSEIYQLHFGSLDGPLHTDRGMRGRVTALATTLGRAEVVLLNGADIRTSTGTLMSEATRLLFEAEVLNLNDVSLPNDALHIELNEGDVLLFDHRQPHAVRSLTPMRESTAYYPHPPS